MTTIDAAFVLAAGLGTRMRPLSLSRPKPLVELAGKALIDHVLDRLRDVGVKTAAVNVHYLADQLEGHLRHRSSPRIIICDEREELLDTGGGAANALQAIGNRPFITANTDSIWIEGARPALDLLIERFDPDRMDCLLLLASVVTSVGYNGAGDFAMDETGRIAERYVGLDHHADDILEDVVRVAS